MKETGPSDILFPITIALLIIAILVKINSHWRSKKWKFLNLLDERLVIYNHLIWNLQFHLDQRPGYQDIHEIISKENGKNVHLLNDDHYQLFVEVIQSKKDIPEFIQVLESEFMHLKRLQDKTKKSLGIYF